MPERLRCGVVTTAARVMWFAAVVASAAVAYAQEVPDSAPTAAAAERPAPGETAVAAPGDPTTLLAAAQRLYYDGRYLDSADRALALRKTGADELASYELRTSALLFQIKRLMGDAKDKDKAFQACAGCPDLLALLLADFREGQTVARARLTPAPDDLEARFFLGKLNLNYVWLQLGVLGKRTGWNEYREARRSMDAVLEKDPAHVRARVARAWIEYIVDTRTPWGFAWILGGGSKKRALETLAAAAADPGAEYFDRIEAEFALWEMHVRERNVPAARVLASRLAADFPENRELRRFLDESGK